MKTWGGSENISPALQALRARTGEVHERLERSVKIGSADAGAETYARHVGAMWGWMRSHERPLWDARWPSTIEAPWRACKTGWLEIDIEWARRDGLLREDLPLAPPVPCDSLAARFGQAYVIEGSMLGGAMLMGRLREKLKPWPLRYLQGYGADTARCWRDFLQALSEHICREEDIEAAAASAHRTFSGIESWLRLRGAA